MRDQKRATKSVATKVCHWQPPELPRINEWAISAASQCCWKHVTALVHSWDSTLACRRMNVQRLSKSSSTAASGIGSSFRVVSALETCLVLSEDGHRQLALPS